MDNVSTDQHVVREVEGWTVKINRHLLTDQAQLGSRAINLLRSKLIEIQQQVPVPACKKLKTIPIWLGVGEGHSPVYGISSWA